MNKIKMIILNILRIIPDRIFLQIRYFFVFHRFFNIKHPIRMTEKIQWLKLYDRRPEYTKMVDKIIVKEYVSTKTNDALIIPTIGVYSKFEDIEFDKLPSKFVIKCTHDSGSCIVCKDKNKVDLNEIKKRITSCLKFNYYFAGREWAYKKVNPKIIIENYIDTPDGLKDYKFFAFNGKVEFLFIASDRNKPGEEVKFDFFDKDFKHLDVRNGHENTKDVIKKPETFEKMKRIVEEIASLQYPMQRIDLYEVNGKVYFGEITLYHFDGLVPFSPDEWDYKFGKYIKINE